jgi:uncharacterized C2H2 Zn-finger protein
MTGPRHQPLSFLTLGDGDFTYSLDCARYLANAKSVQLTATGIDTKEQLYAKYKDASFVLQQLESTSSSHLSVTINHGVNAIITNENNKHSIKADHVIFHHPHVGTEDATLHARFLSHLFHSVSNHWMTSGGIFHLSLVSGQCERWKCLEAAERQGFSLLTRQHFSPPPVTIPTYHFRRHQTGRSFESRRPDHESQSFTFGRNNEEWIARCLPWQTTNCTTSQRRYEAKSKEEDSGNMLDCPFCDKVFREERSRKCHVRSKHPNGSEKKQKVEFVCHECRTEDDNPRYFASEVALQDHSRAKHSALHKEISPDWQKPQPAMKKNEEKDFGSCAICGFRYQDERQRSSHMTEFIPKEAIESFHCRFCSKSFREKRASQQHENFCSQRSTVG